MHPRRGSLLVPICLLRALFGFFFICGAPLLVFAEPMVITDRQGRVIQAEPISLVGDTLKIRRDDGREFDVPVDNLSDEDQARVRAWGAEQAKKSGAANSSDAFASADPKPGSSSEAKPAKPEKPAYKHDPAKINVSLSRVKTDTTTLYKSEGYSHKHEMWAYGIQVMNRNLHTVEKLRIEYNLFARTFSDSSTPSVVVGNLDLPAVGSNRSESARTKAAEVCKLRGYYFYGDGGEMRGIWIKVFLDGELIQEQITPGSLKTEVEWTPVSESRRSRPRLVGDAHYY